MPAFFARGTQKPPLGAQMNPAHPFAQDVRVCLPFNETFVGAIANSNQLPRVIQAGPVPTRWAATLAGGNANWTSNRDGPAVNVAVGSGNALQLTGGGAGAADPIPTAAITILYIRRKTDTTQRTCSHFGISLSTAGTSACTGFFPFSDGTTYWDFGGPSGANRLTVAGLSYAATVERWVFTAGPQGSAMWRNGIKLASQSTAITRVASGSAAAFLLNGVAFAGDNGDSQEITFFQMNGTQWADDRCRWWNAEPYAHLYPQTAQRRYFLLGNLAASATVRGTVFRTPIFGRGAF
jgi:hypothetical protein